MLDAPSPWHRIRRTILSWVQTRKHSKGRKRNQILWKGELPKVFGGSVRPEPWNLYPGHIWTQCLKAPPNATPFQYKMLQYSCAQNVVYVAKCNENIVLNNVAIWCIEMFCAFGRAFTHVLWWYFSSHSSNICFSLCLLSHTVSTLFLKPASAPLVQPVYPLKSTNQSSAPAKSTSQTSLSSPIAPSNLSAMVKAPFSSGVSGANFSDWSPWSRCSATCGHQAVTHRKRTCKLIGAKTCQGSNTETKHCQSLRCPGIARKKLTNFKPI